MPEARTCDDRRNAAEPSMDTVPKLCGADAELGNFILGVNLPEGTANTASKAILDQIEGVPSLPPGMGSLGATTGRFASEAMFDALGGGVRDSGRKFLPANGGCAYIDLGHLEVCTPEVCSAHEYVAAWHAMLLIVRAAIDRANVNIAPGVSIQAVANTSDGKGNSYGSHVNVLITRRAWNNIFQRKLHDMLFLASHLASSIVFAGAGKAGAEDGSASIPFQLSERADFIEVLSGKQTTNARPLVNSRDESLCGPPASFRLPDTLDHRLARIHVICYDSNLCHVANLLKMGTLQIVLAMIEQENVPTGLTLDDPVLAMKQWSRDPCLRAAAPLVFGEMRTALDMQDAVAERAARFVAEGRADGLVPRAGEIVALWQQTLAELRAGDFATLRTKLDWVLKHFILERAVRTKNLSWESNDVRLLDQLYANLDARNGLYWAYERANALRQVVEADEIERLTREAPPDTRAWLRAEVLRRAPQKVVDGVDWDVILLRFRRRGAGDARYLLRMHDPFGRPPAECAAAFAEASDLEDAARRLGAVKVELTVELPPAPSRRREKKKKS